MQELDKIKTKFGIHTSPLTCNKHVFLETKIVDLNQIMCKYEKGKMIWIIF